MDINEEMLKYLINWKKVTEKNIMELRNKIKELDIKIDELTDGHLLEDTTELVRLVNLESSMYSQIEHLNHRLTKLDDLIDFEEYRNRDTFYKFKRKFELETVYHV